MQFYIFHSVLLVLVAIQQASGGYVLTVVPGSNLPEETKESATVYDGDNSIYILGGRNVETGRMSDAIIRFCITTGNVDIVGRLPAAVSGGSAIWDGQGNIFYFGGTRQNYHCFPSIWKSTVGPNRNLTSIIVTEWGCGNCYATAVWDGVDNAYILGGLHPRGLYAQYIKSTSRLNFIGRSFGYTISEAVTAWDGNGTAYTFGGYKSDDWEYKGITKFTPAEHSIEPIGELPATNSGGSAVWSGTYAFYIPIGNYYYDLVLNKTFMVRFDPVTSQTENLQVGGHSELYVKTGSVYVPKNRRIYVIGFSINNMGGIFRPQVMYIQL